MPDLHAHTSSQDFRFFCPVEAFAKGGDEATSMGIRGFITTEHKDREGEDIIQSGLDFSEFLSFGHFNDNHSQKTADMLGWPTLVEARETPDGRKGHYVEGYLIRGYEPAEEIWNLSRKLKENNAPRQLGFSVEGKILKRLGDDGKTIAKAKVRNVAITSQPVNPYAGMEPFVKAMTAGAGIEAPAVASPGDAFSLRTESMEGRQVSQDFSLNPTVKRLTRSESIQYLKSMGYSDEQAEQVWSLASKLN